MRTTKTEAGVALVGGALFGAAMMYLMDPKQGDRRRQMLSAKSREALQGATDMLGSTWEHARDMGSSLAEHADELTGRLKDRAQNFASSAGETAKNKNRAARHAARHWRDRAAKIAQDLGERGESTADDVSSGMSSHLHDLGDRASHFGHSLMERARHLGRRSAAHAGDWMDDARQSSHEYRHALAKAIDPEHVRGPGHVAGWSAGLVGVLAAGAGAMYIFDPSRGGERRQWIWDRATSAVSDVGSFARKTGRGLAGKAREVSGRATEQLSSSSGGETDGERLLDRIRTALSHALTHPHQIQLMCDAQGNVTVYGRIPEDEVDRMLSTIRSVRGVTEVKNLAGAASSADIHMNPTTTRATGASVPQL